MHAILNTFKSGVGDCVFMRLIKDDATFSIMIDCGKYTPEINLFIKEKLHKHIDLLIVTHIDDDHINGVCEMLIAMPEITIGKIFYNCYQLLSGEKLEHSEMHTIFLRPLLLLLTFYWELLAL